MSSPSAPIGRGYCFPSGKLIKLTLVPEPFRVRFEIGVSVSLDLVYDRFYKTLTKAAGFPIHALGNDGELGQCRVECVFELPRPIAAILRNAKRANSPATEGREFSAA